MVVLPLHSSPRISSQSSSSAGKSSPLHSKSTPAFASGRRNWTDYPHQLPRFAQKLRSPPRRSATLLLLAIITFLYFTSELPQSSSEGRAFRSWNGIPYYGREMDPYSDGACRLNMTAMQSLNLTREFSYARRYIKQTAFERGPNRKANLAWVDDLQQLIFAGQDFVSLGEDWLQKEADSKNIISLPKCSSKPLLMHTRQPRKPINAKKHVFGVATTPERLLEFASTTALWLGNTGARLIVIVPEGPRVQELTDHLANLGILATVITSKDDFLVNYFRLVEAFHSHGGPDAQWFTFVDDDTHFFHLQRFMDVLSKYDPKTELYLGSPSEDFRQMVYDGLFAFGGAGITVSRGLLNHLHAEFESCLFEQEWWVPGDVRVKRCVYQHTDTKLTMLPGLHQVDLIGDTIGLLEGPRPPMTWHHYRSWSPTPVELYSKAAQVCNGACLFQRWRAPSSPDFGFGSMTLHFGISIVGYSPGISPDFSKAETTWEVYPESKFDHSLPPLRPGLKEGIDRFTFRLKAIGKDVDGHVKHTYIRYVGGDRRAGRDERRKSLALERSVPTVAIAEEENKGTTENDIDAVMELVFL